MKNLIAAFCLLTISATGVASEMQECTVRVVERSTETGKFHRKYDYPITLQKSVEACFQQAILVSELPVHQDKDNKSTIIEWVYDDRGFLDSDGHITANTRICMTQLNDSNFLGNKLYNKHCQTF